MDGEKLRDGIFALRTRRFGSVAECMVRRLLSCSAAKSIFHDLFDDAKRHRIEVKFSVVRKEAKLKVTEVTVLQCIEDAVEDAVIANGMVSFTQRRNFRFDCNIQQVKRAEFDVLYYGLFFSDCIKIFCIESDEIKLKRDGGKISYSNKQHKGNIGEGQFHINDRTLDIHLQHYLYKTLSYDKLSQLLTICE